MNQTTAIILAVIAIIVFVAGFKAIVKYTKKVYQETGYNPFSKSNLTLMCGILVLPLIVGLVVAKGSAPTVEQVIPMVIAAILPIAILVYRNMKLKKVSWIVLFTVMQIIGGILIVVLLFCHFALKTGIDMALDRTDSATFTYKEIQQTARDDACKANKIANEHGFRDAKEVEDTLPK